MSKKILIVDDDLTYIETLKKILIQLKFEPVAAESGLHALSILRDSYVDLMLIDIMMPDLDGYEVIWSLRNHKKYKAHSKVPMIALTVLSKDIVKARLKEIGADAWIQKPVTPKRLGEILDQFLSTPVQK